METGPRGIDFSSPTSAVTRVSAPVVLSCSPVSSLIQRRGHARVASEILKQSQNRSDSERLIQCPYCSQRYLLVWDDKEWNSVKDWIRVAEAAVRKSHRAHGDIALPLTLKVHP